MTEYDEVNYTCLRCDWFNTLRLVEECLASENRELGYCNCPLSDHCGHVITWDHAQCEHFNYRG